MIVGELIFLRKNIIWDQLKKTNFRKNIQGNRLETIVKNRFSLSLFLPMPYQSFFAELGTDKDDDALQHQSSSKTE